MEYEIAGGAVQVDEEDVPALDLRNWWIMRSGGREYAMGTGKVLMHRFLMSPKDSCFASGREIVHHVDGDGLNNTRGNLQVMAIGDHIRLHALFRALLRKNE